MNCPNCQTPNREAARFCRTCGLWLLPRCPFCDAEISVPAAFCDRCGRRLSDLALQPSPPPISQPPRLQSHQLLPPRLRSPDLQSLISDELAAKLHTARAERAMEGQRRVVTMLFCDVQGSTEAASRLDPEEWAVIINGAFEHMISPVYRYEGTVARLMGDGLLAFFGAPIAHEDDPLRAVLAGIEIVEGFQAYREQIERDWRLEINVRVGINTGLVVVGAVGSDLQVEYTALGDAINVAARMEQTAQPGTVQVGEDTYRLVAPLFEWEDLGELTVKGKDDPVHTYRPLRPRPVSGRVRGIEGREAPIIGRDRELAALWSAYDHLRQRGVGCIVFLTGEAGIGKSRLIRELKAASFGSEGQPGLSWYEIAPYSFETSQPYALFRSFLRKVAGLDEESAPHVARQKLAALVDRLPVEMRASALMAFYSLLGVEEDGNGRAADGESFKRQLFAAAREVVRVLFAAAPGVIVLDDLHWADPASVEMFGHLFPLVDAAPVLFLCAARQERDAPIWQLKARLENELPHRYVEILVGPLTAPQSNVLVDHLLAVAELPPRIRKMILDKSEGNPFFLEEIVRSLMEEVSVAPAEDGAGGARRRIEEEVSTITIPDNLQTLVAARLDRLDEDTLRVLQMAAVIGRTFHFRVLQTISGQQNGLQSRLSELQRMDMIVEASRMPELQYAFRHALVQETAYRSILLKQRKEFHRRVGEAMETLFVARLDEYAPILAMHFERAGEDERAYRYYVQAGDAAFRLFAIQEAISYYSRALAFIKKARLQTDNCRHVFLQLGRTLEMDGRYEDALAHYIEMEAYAREWDDRALELAALAAHATIHAAPTGKYDPEDAEALSQRALAIAEELNDYQTQAKIYWNLMLMATFQSENKRSYKYGLRSLEIARKYNLREQLAYTLNDFQRVVMMMGEIELSQQYLAEAQQIWQELGNKPMFYDSLISSTFQHWALGEYERVEALALEALEGSRAIGNLWGQSYSQYILGFLYATQGKVDQAVEVMHNCLRLAELSGFAVPLVDTNAYLGMLYGFLGDFVRGERYAELAVQNAKKRLPAMEPAAKSVLAILEYWKGNPDGMDEWLEGTPIFLDITSYSGFLRIVSEGYRWYAKRDYPKLLAVVDEFLPQLIPYGRLILISEIYRLQAEALLAQGRVEEACEAAARSLETADHSPAAMILPLLLMDRIKTLQGDQESAASYRQQARQQIETILQHIGDADLRASFLARPFVRAAMEKSR